jgi:hypothetical protein
VRAGLLARKGAVDISGGFASDDDERDSDYKLWRCRGAAGTAELNAQVAVSAFVDFAVGTVKVRPIQRHRKQQRRHRKEGDELAGAHLTQAVEHSAHLSENASSQRGQVHLPRCAHFLGRHDGALNASRMVMRRTLSVYCSRHTALFCSPPRVAERRSRGPRATARSIYCNTSLDNRNCM